MRISILFFGLNNVAKSQKNWYSILLKLMNVLKHRSVSWAKYIIESHLSADRSSLTNKIFPELDEVFLCTRYGIRKLENREVDNIFQQSKNDIRTVPGQSRSPSLRSSCRGTRGSGIIHLIIASDWPLEYNGITDMNKPGSRIQ